MAIRFRKSIKLAPGIRWNVGLKSSSVSFGPRGAKVTVGTHGTRATVGLPGTGLSVTETVRRQGSTPQTLLGTSSEAPIVEDVELAERMEIPPLQKRGWGRAVFTGILIAGSVIALAADLAWLFILLLIAGIIVVSSAPRLPDRGELARRELTRRLEEWTPMLLAAYDAPSRSAFEAIIARQQQLRLRPDDISQEVADTLDGYMEFFDFVDELKANGGTIKELPGYERLVGNQPVFYVAANVYYDRRGPNDDEGTLYFAKNALIFQGASRVEAPWSKVATVRRDGRSLEVQRRDRQTPLVFVMSGVGDALKALQFGNNLLKQSSVG